MEEQEVEVSFCDLCGTSVPAGDIETGIAALYQGKTVGDCCLAGLREAAATGMSKTQPKSGEEAFGMRPVVGDGGRLLTVAIFLLAALGGGIMFLDSRLSDLKGTVSTAASTAAERQMADSDALRRLAVKSGTFAQQAGLELVKSEVSALGAAVNVLREDAARQQDDTDQEFVSLRDQLRQVTEKLIDYRPLFEDLRQRHARAMAAIDGMRGEVRTAPVADSLPPDLAVPGKEEPAVDLPEKLAAQVRKLASPDAAVRFEAVDLLVESKDAKVLPHLLPLAKDPDAFVRRLTVEGLREFKKPEAVDALIASLLDDDENVCDTAWRSLRDVTGQKFKFVASASKAARARAAQSWQTWWDKARDSFAP